MSFSWSTFALQAINFLVLVWLLKRFLFRPVGAIIARRKEEIASAQAQAAAARTAAEQARKDFEAQKLQIESERQAILDRARAQLADERSAMVEAARADAEKLKAAALKRLEEERNLASQQVFAQSIQIAVRIAQRLLQQFPAPCMEDLFLARVLDHLDQLSAVERAELLGDAAHDDHQLLVTTAAPLDSEAAEKWRAALCERFGARSRIEFSSDAELIAGAELKFPRAILRFSWRDALNQAERELAQNEHAG
jgi:F-type H+-transporting ATPase subunit b